MKNKRTWKLIYDAVIFPVFCIVAGIIFILSAQLMPFSNLEKSRTIIAIIVIFLIFALSMTCYYLKRDGFIFKKK
ncbi:hypothetical protein [Oenococcus oeni]|uniref:hypothetical protein n=1 Tax=Oenococcus oeni TaxID=1247 RepID=UPI001079FE5C|nr:hypothetical protein [Oenococcus oeni]AVI93401.1 hypothetical protein AX764_00300 [Oenococcus oeni]SYW04233.1 conserved hypothetical protein [Oenococcus oeni]